MVIDVANHSALEWTTATCNWARVPETPQNGTFDLSVDSEVHVHAKVFEKPLHWNLLLDPGHFFRVLAVSTPKLAPLSSYID